MYAKLSSNFSTSTLGLLVSKGFLEYIIIQPRAQLENSAFKKPLLPVITFICLQLPVVTCSQLPTVLCIHLQLPVVTNCYLQLELVTYSYLQQSLVTCNHFSYLQLPALLGVNTCSYLLLPTVTCSYPQLPIDILPLLPVVTLSLLLPNCYHCN